MFPLRSHTVDTLRASLRDLRAQFRAEEQAARARAEWAEQMLEQVDEKFGGDHAENGAGPHAFGAAVLARLNSPGPDRCATVDGVVRPAVSDAALDFGPEFQGPADASAESRTAEAGRIAVEAAGAGAPTMLEVDWTEADGVDAAGRAVEADGSGAAKADAADEDWTVAKAAGGAVLSLLVMRILLQTAPERLSRAELLRRVDQILHIPAGRHEGVRTSLNKAILRGLGRGHFDEVANRIGLTPAGHRKMEDDEGKLARQTSLSGSTHSTSPAVPAAA